MDKTVRDALKSHTAAYNLGLATGNMDKAAFHNVRRMVKETKQCYEDRVVTQMQQCDPKGL